MSYLLHRNICLLACVDRLIQDTDQLCSLQSNTVLLAGLLRKASTGEGCSDDELSLHGTSIACKDRQQALVLGRCTLQSHFSPHLRLAGLELVAGLRALQELGPPQPGRNSPADVDPRQHHLLTPPSHGGGTLDSSFQREGLRPFRRAPH